MTAIKLSSAKRRLQRFCAKYPYVVDEAKFQVKEANGKPVIYYEITTKITGKIDELRDLFARNDFVDITNAAPEQPAPMWSDPAQAVFEAPPQAKERKVAKEANGKAKTAKEPKARKPGKLDKLLQLLQRQRGVSLIEAAEKLSTEDTAWKPSSVRNAMAFVAKRAGMKIERIGGEKEESVYKVA